MINFIKNNFYLILAASLLQPLVAKIEQNKTARNCKFQQSTVKQKKEKAKRGCCNAIILTKKDFCKTGTVSKTAVLDHPGTYLLGENIDFAPDAPFTPAIQILSNDVTVDLCGNTLRQVNNISDVSGIQLGLGYDPFDRDKPFDPNVVLQNVTITNGTIRNFSAMGVFCNNASFDFADPDKTYLQIPFQSLTFTDLNIYECGTSPSNYFASGLVLDSLADFELYLLDIPVAYRNVSIKRCNVERCLGNGSILAYTADNLILDHVRANDLTSTISTFFGSDYGPSAYYIVARNVQMTHCQGNNTRDEDPNTVNAVVGSWITESINVTVSDSQFNNTYGESDRLLVGLFLDNLQNGLLERTQVNTLRGGELCSALNGIHMSDNFLQENQANGIKFVECQFNDITRPATGVPATVPSFVARTNCIGFRALTTRNVVFERCQSTNISTENPFYDCFGICLETTLEDPRPFFANVRNVVLKDFVVSDVESVNRAGGITFQTLDFDRTGQQGALLNLVADNCTVQRIKSSSSTELITGIGAFPKPVNIVPRVLPAIFNIEIKGCTITDVRSNTDNPSPLSAGIVAASVTRPKLLSNDVSDSDRGILLSGSNDIFPAILFQLAETFEDATTFPPVAINLTSLPDPTCEQSFTNMVAGRGGPIIVTPSLDNVSLTRDFILSPVDLNFSGGETAWQPGDTIIYNNGGCDNIGGLTSRAEPYFLIVYRPGFSNNGIVKDNEVDNCTIASYQDASPTTTTLWTNNTAYNTGTAINYAINWGAIAAPIDEGSLTNPALNYPAPGNKYYNLSMNR